MLGEADAGSQCYVDFAHFYRSQMSDISVQPVSVQSAELLQHDHEFLWQATGKRRQQYMGRQIPSLDLPGDDGAMIVGLC